MKIKQNTQYRMRFVNSTVVFLSLLMCIPLTDDSNNIKANSGAVFVYTSITLLNNGLLADNTAGRLLVLDAMTLRVVDSGLLIYVKKIHRKGSIANSRK